MHPGVWWQTIFDLMALNRVEVGLLLEAGGRYGGVVQDVGPLDTFEDEMVALRRHGGPLEVGWESPHSVHWSSIKEEAAQQPSSNHPTHNNPQPPSQGHHQNHQGYQAGNRGTNRQKRETPNPPTDDTPPIPHPHQSEGTCAQPKQQYEQLGTSTIHFSVSDQGIPETQSPKSGTVL